MDQVDGRAGVSSAAVGEGHRRPLWIWFRGGMQENMQDPLTKVGMYNLSQVHPLLLI